MGQYFLDSQQQHLIVSGLRQAQYSTEALSDEVSTPGPYGLGALLSVDPWTIWTGGAAAECRLLEYMDWERC